MGYLEKAAQLFQTHENRILEFPLAPVFLGYCSLYCGRFHQAIGSLDFNWRLALERSDYELSATIRSIFGTALVLLNNHKEGLHHLEQAKKEATAAANAMALYLSCGGIAVYHFQNGRIKEAHEVLSETIIEGAKSGLIRQFSSPWVLEMLYEFHRLGFEPIPEMSYPEVMDRIIPETMGRLWQEINIHLQGVALRLRAKEKMEQGDDSVILYIT